MTRWLLSWNNSDQDFICLLGLWYNLNKTGIEKSRPPSLLYNLVERKKEKRETERSARKLIWTGINSIQSPLASLMGAHRTVRVRGKSRKDGLHPFLWPSLTAVILSSFNPHFSQSLPLPPNLRATAGSFSLPLHPSIRPRQRHYVLTQPAKGTN